MMRIRSTALPLLLGPLLLAGCDMAPHYVRPASAAPPQWPEGAAYAPAAPGQAGLPWRGVFADEKLRTLIGRALAGNRDLRATIASVASARAQYHVTRSAQLPTISAGASATVQRGGRTSGGDVNSYAADASVSSFELDLFGRLKNETKASFETYLSTESGMRSARLTLVAETATAYATLASDRDLLRVAQDTLASGQRSVGLTRSLFDAGLAAAGDVQDAITIAAQAQSDVEADTTQVAQDRNALELLVGGPIEDVLLPASLADLDGSVGHVPAGLSSDVLLQRPDVLEAEHSLKGANASIGAARAAFFPTISLTSAAGVASSALSSLFTGGALNWNVAPTASVPLIGGTTRGNLDYAKSQRDYYVAEYEKAVQTAFREVADGLARRGTIDRQRAAQARLVDAAAKSYDLADTQYRAGTDSFLNALTAQRTLYAARQTQIATVLADIENRITLYQVVGSDDTL